MSATSGLILDSPVSERQRPQKVSAPPAYLSRQPIYNFRREIEAYELFHRVAAADTAAAFEDGDRASAQVVLQAFLDIGLERVAGGRPVFINYTASLLPLGAIIPADRCVIEVLENIAVTPKTLDALQDLKKLGYGIALDDFAYAPHLDPFLELADYVKLDVRALAPEEFDRHMELLKPLGKHVVAEKVESEAELRRCHAAGCKLFQGYYLRRPETVTGSRIPSNRLSALALLTECLQSPSKSIAAAIDRDATLTYGLLQLANSVMYGTSRELRNTIEAVVRLGTDRVFRWAALLVIASHDDCPGGYLEFALQRAHMTEGVAAGMRLSRNDGYLVGLLSTLDSVFGVPLERIIAPLPLSPELIAAILERHGPLGEILDAVMAYETCGFDVLEHSPIGIDLLQKSFWEAAGAARDMIGQLGVARGAK